jgi:hypothetical protein
MKKTNQLRPIEVLDKAVILIGIAMIGIGLYMIYPPVMFIVVGAIFALPGLPRKEVK